MKRLVLFMTGLLFWTCLVFAEEEKKAGIRMTDTRLQVGTRLESLTKQGTPKKVIYREKVFDYFIEPYYDRAYFNLIPDARFVSGLNFNDKIQVSAELGFNYYLNEYLLYSRGYSYLNYDQEQYIWQPSFTRKNYYTSYLVKAETLNDESELNTTLSAGRFNVEYTPLTLKRSMNGVLWEMSGGDTRFILAGSQLENFNQTKKYIFSARMETEQLGIGTVGVSFVNSWYDQSRVSAARDTDYEKGRESGKAAVYLRFKDRSYWDGDGAVLRKLRIEAAFRNGFTNHTCLDEFRVQDQTEQKYLFESDGLSSASGMTRRADLNGRFTYRIILPEGVKSIRFTSEVAGDYLVEYSFDNEQYHMLDVQDGRIDTSDFETRTSEIFIMPDRTGDTYVYLAVRDDTPEDGYGAVLYKLEYFQDGKLSVSFEPSADSGSDESQYLYTDYYSVYRTENGRGMRLADGAGYFIYRFPVKEGIGNIKFRMMLKNDFQARAYLEGFEDEARVLHSQGQEKEGLNEGFYELSLESYDDIYANTYVSRSKKIIGVDYKTKVAGIDLYTEADTLIDERVMANGETRYKNQYAFVGRLEKIIQPAGLTFRTKYYKVDTGYRAEDFIEDNVDQNQFKDELEPFNIDHQYVNYDPNLDIYNYDRNYTEVFDHLPVYAYQWNINETSYLSYDQQGCDAAVELEKFLSCLSTGITYSGAEQLSTGLLSDKLVYKLKFTQPVPADSYIDNEYRLEYIRDERELSQNNDNLKNFLKFLYSYWGIKGLNWQFGLNQLYFNRNQESLNTDLKAEFLTSLKYTMEILRDFLAAPAYMVKFYRHFNY
ncbi:MAG: hypothetical protein PHF84_03225, partial [bacterium]|nr:hypothetical protein [bacterium]